MLFFNEFQVGVMWWFAVNNSMNGPDAASQIPGSRSSDLIVDPIRRELGGDR